MIKKILFIIITVALSQYARGQGLPPFNIEGTPYQGGFMRSASVKVWDSVLEDSLYLYEHVDSSFLSGIGGGSGTVKGTGASRKVPFFVNSDSLTVDSLWYTTGDVISLGTSSPTVTGGSFGFAAHGNLFSSFRLTNAFTGSGASGGTSIYTYADSLYIANLENGAVTIGVNSVERFRVDANGLKIENLKSGGTAPTTSGTLVKLVSDANGRTSFQTNNTGTVTSAGLIAGTSGTDVNVSGSPITASGNITLNIPTASGTNTGKLSSTDWNTFNNKFTLPSLTSGSVLFSNGTTISQNNTKLFWNNSTERLGIGNNSPSKKIHVTGNALVTTALTVGADLSGFEDYGFTVNTSNGGIILNRTSSSDAFIRMSNASGHGGQIRTSSLYGANSFALAELIGTPMGYFTTTFARLPSLYTQYGNGSGGGSNYQILLGFGDAIGGSTYRIPQGIKTRHDSGGAANNAIDFYTWNVGDNLTPSVHAMTMRNGLVGVNQLAPSRTLHVSGEMRVTDLTTDTPTGLVGADGDGDFGTVAIGTGLSFSAGTLSSTGDSDWGVIGGDMANWGATGTFGSGLNVGIGTASPSRDLDVNGDTRLRGAIYNSSNSAGSSGQVLTSQGASAFTWTTPTTGTVTSAGLTTGTTGTDINVSGSPITSSGNITLNIPTASGTNTGKLSSTDWTTFNNKFTLPALTSGSVLFSNGTTISQNNTKFFWNNSTERLGIGNNSPSRTLHVTGEMRVTDLTTDTPTGLVGADGDGDFGNITLGAGLSITDGTLNTSAGGPDSTILTEGYGINIIESPANNYNIATDTTQLATQYDLTLLVPQSRTINTTTPLQGGGNLSTNRTLSILEANASQSGYLSSTNFNLFNSKPYGGGVAGRVSIWDAVDNITSDANMFWDFTNDRLGIGTTSPSANLHITGNVRIEGGSGTPTTIMGRNATGSVNILQLGSGFSISSGFLNYSETGNGTVTSIGTNNGITGGTITGSGTIGLTGQALTVHNYTGTGIITRSAGGTFAGRSIAAGTGVTVTNGDGVSGNPTVTVTNPLPAGASSQTLAYLSGAWTASSFLKTNSSTTTTGNSKRVTINDDVGGESWPLSINTATKFLVNGRVQMNSTASSSVTSMMGRNADMEVGIVNHGANMDFTAGTLSQKQVLGLLSRASGSSTFSTSGTPAKLDFSTNPIQLNATANTTNDDIVTSISNYGAYEIKCDCQFNPGSTATYNFGIYVNGSLNGSLVKQIPMTSGVTHDVVIFGWVQSLATTDEVDIRVSTTSGTSGNTITRCNLALTSL